MQKVRIMALGGLDEDGKNMYVIEIDEDIFVIEAGIKYPESAQLGVEYIIPDFTYLKENSKRIKGIFITHGHDDVMSALPFLLKEIDLDIYATALTAKYIEPYIDSRKRVKIIKRNDNITVAGHLIHSFPVMQSIADGIGLVFETDQGAIIYSGEFIIDYDFTNPYFSMDINVMSKLNNKKVLCLLSESVGALKQGYTTPRHRISQYIEPYFEYNNIRIVMSLYSQNLYRIIEILEMAKKYKKRVYFYDKEHVKQLKIIENLGYYKIPSGLIVEDKDFNNQLRDIIVIVSGAGNKVFKLMNNIAIGEDSKVELNEDDLVIIASPIVPGTEKVAAHMEDDIYKAGVKVVKLSSKEVLSMHASKEDLKTMLYFIKPKYYLPIKGDYAALIANADIALEMGYTADKIIILDNGQFATFENEKLISTRDCLTLNDTLIDGSDKTDVSGMVLKDREALSTDGAIILGVYLDFKTKEVMGGPDVQSRGVIYLKDADYILSEIGNILIDTINTAVKEGRYENMPVRMEAKEKITRYVLKETGKKPMILPAIIEINLD
ncbi:MAG: ribonuclease J [Solobacterium sp.]|nr:ribonuclease J [Solobacterium sp.]MDY4642164.1 ribonuclease J [Erysipelotrichaceae bacterium]MCI7732054.1 ribonuclease J [Solobacterium sp.]MDD6498092.1 ribonuclease J [Solobacterium sp.]MDD6956207.1 ribonuclease J [Solobacterium sp.]